MHVRNSGPEKQKPERVNAWRWLPTLYFAEGIPYVIVMTLSVIFYKRMGVSNADIALYTSWLYLPWVIKPLWSPIVDILKTKRLWIIIMQLFIGAGLAGVALTIPVPGFFKYTLAFFWLLAFSSATHDIAADGFYMLALTRHEQTFFVGIRSTFYRIAMLTGQGLLVILAGYFEARTGLPVVEVEVSAVTEEITGEVFDPAAISVRIDDSDLYFFSNEEIRISMSNISAQEAADMIGQADGWNIIHGFYPEGESSDADGDEPGWWSRRVSGPLAAMLGKRFADEQLETVDLAAGNVGYTWFHLSRPPEENQTVILNFTRTEGDKSIRLVRDYRYAFNDKNWNIPAVALFQLDPKLDKEVVAGFTGVSGNITLSWSIVFIVIAAIFLLFFFYHRFALPRPSSDHAVASENGNLLREFFATFALFFKRREIGVILFFLLVYRLGESQLVKLASPFLLDSREVNGLGLTTGDLGLIYGTIGMVALTLGGILGGVVAARKGLKYWLWWMVLAMNLPNLVYVFLSVAMPSSLWIIGSSVAVEQFGYGFGFTAYMLYMIYISEGKHKTAHFAIATGFMALGMMIPGMFSGWLQEIIGYQNFFIWVMICTIPAFAIIPFLGIDPGFGKKSSEE
jgi:MFS transporter, PAT family, beta-lactamase induction signal transducer AmpG